MHLIESKLLPNLSMLHRYSARDVADMCFCYMLALHMCRQEFETAPWCRTYAQNTLSVHDWRDTNLNKTDLHQLLSVLIGKNHTWTHYLKNEQASQLLLNEIYVDPHLMEMFLHNLQHVTFNTELSGRLLLQMERDLHVMTSNYKSMRRILTDWQEDHVTTEAKSLVMTRLLQALRAKARTGDIIHKVEDLAKSRRWEIHHACDPETGKNCGVSSHTHAHKPSLIKQLAIGAGVGVGAFLLGKALFGSSKK